MNGGERRERECLGGAARATPPSPALLALATTHTHTPSLRACAHTACCRGGGAAAHLPRRIQQTLRPPLSRVNAFMAGVEEGRARRASRGAQHPAGVCARGGKPPPPLAALGPHGGSAPRCREGAPTSLLPPLRPADDSDGAPTGPRRGQAKVKYVFRLLREGDITDALVDRTVGGGAGGARAACNSSGDVAPAVAWPPPHTHTPLLGVGVCALCALRGAGQGRKGARARG